MLHLHDVGIRFSFPLRDSALPLSHCPTVELRFEAPLRIKAFGVGQPVRIDFDKVGTQHQFVPLALYWL